jgi:transposase
MIRAGFLSTEDRSDLIALARDGSATHRLARRANALVLLDAGWNCQEVAGALLLDDDTIRTWHNLFVSVGIEGLARFETGGSACQMNDAQLEEIKAWVTATLPRSTRQIGAFIEKRFAIVYESRSGLIALLHRLGLEYHKPDLIPSKLNEEKQKNFIAEYDNLLNSLADSEAVLFADAVHPTHAVRAAGCWAPKQETLAIGQTSGRQRINIHGAINLETGQTRMIEVLTVAPCQQSGCWIRSRRSIRCSCSSMSFSTTHAIIMPNWCRNGLPGLGAGSNCISSRPIVRISIRLNGCGASCTETSPTTRATPHVDNSRTRRSGSCVKRFHGTGRTSAIRSPTIFAS